MKVILIAAILALSVGCQGETQTTKVKAQDAGLPDAQPQAPDASPSELYPDMLLPTPEVGC